MNKARIAEVFFLIALTTAVFFLYFMVQPVLTYAGCKLCDGHQYLSMFNYFEGNTAEYKATFPYYSRGFVPYLASLLPVADALLSFQLINLLFSIASVLAIYYLWKSLNIPFALIAIGLFWLLFHWTGIIRLNALDAFTVDVPTYLFQTLLIFIVLRGRYEYLFVLGPVAVLQRESITILMLVLLSYAFLHNTLFKTGKEIPVLTIVMSILLTILVKYLYTLQFPPMDPEKSSVRLVLFYIREVVYDPFKILRWITGVFMAFGVFLILALQKTKYKMLWAPFPLFLTLMSLMYVVLGIIAGGDSTRIVFLGFPFIMTWILLQLKDVSWLLIALALLLSTILMNLIRVIPDPGKDFLKFASWYPEFGTEAMVLGWLGYFAGCFVILFIINRFLKVR